MYSSNTGNAGNSCNTGIPVMLVIQLVLLIQMMLDDNTDIPCIYSLVGHPVCYSHKNMCS